MSQELEKMLLAKLTNLKDIARIHELGLHADVFVDVMHKYAFSRLMQYWADTNMTVAPTWVVIDAEFPNLNLEHDVTESVEWLVDSLNRRYTTNEMQKIMHRALDAVEADPIGAMSSLWHESYAAVETTAPRLARSNMAENVHSRAERYQRRTQTQEGGATLGLPALDTHTRGLLPGELCAVAAYTKVGKTFFLLNAAVAARRAGLTPLIMTLEQSIPEIEDRIDALFSQVSYQRLQAGTLYIPESERLNQARDEMKELGPIHIEKPGRGERTIRNMVTRCRQLGADYLIIDQLSFIDAEREYRGDKGLTQKHGELIFDLKDAVAQDSAGVIPCLLAVQLNRETMRQPLQQAQGGRGGLWNFANSSAIEQTVDLALGLWRSREARANNSMMIDIMGARRCAPKSWVLSWHLSDSTEIGVRQEFTE